MLHGQTQFSIVALVGLLLGAGVGVDTPLAAQEETPWRLGFRVGAGVHLAGLNKEFPTSNAVVRYRLEPALDLGAVLSYRLGHAPLALRMDYDRLFDVRPERPESPTVSSEGGHVQWLSASVRYTPELLCGVACLSTSLGGGWGWYRLEAQELRGDVVFRFSRPGGSPALRFGVDVSVPGVWEPLRLSIADYVGDVSTHFDNTDFTPVHILHLAVEASFPAFAQ